jgi:hypothetical protein
MVARISKINKLWLKVQVFCLSVRGLLLINIMQELANDNCLQNEWCFARIFDLTNKDIIYSMTIN